MKRTIEMYKMTKMVNDIIVEAEARHPEIIHENGRLRPQMKYVAEQYAKKYKVSYHHAADLLNSCMSTSNNYILPEEGRALDDSTPVHVASGSGQDLIDSWLGIPWGLLSAIWGKHGSFISFVTGGVVIGALVAFVGFVWGGASFLIELIMSK